MGTILAVKKDKKICIAADCMTFSGGTRKQTAEYVSNYDKIFQYRENYMGITGGTFPSWPLLFEDYFKKLKTPAKLNTREEIFRTFIQFHSELKDQYFLNPLEDDGDEFESSRFQTLLINPDGIFKVYQLRSVQQFSRFWAIGQGAPYALGAMEALYDQLATSEEIAMQALQATAAFDDSTALPATLYTVTSK